VHERIAAALFEVAQRLGLGIVEEILHTPAGARHDRFARPRIDERVDLACEQHLFTAPAGRHAFDRDARRCRNIDDLVVLNDPHDILGPHAVFAFQVAFGERRDRHLRRADRDSLPSEIARLANARARVDEHVQLTEEAARKDGRRGKRSTLGFRDNV
jgi:hypothetical protein